MLQVKLASGSMAVAHPGHCPMPGQRWRSDEGNDEEGNEEDADSTLGEFFTDFPQNDQNELVSYDRKEVRDGRSEMTRSRDKKDGSTGESDVEPELDSKSCADRA